MINNYYQISFTSRECVDSIKYYISNAKSTIDIELYYFINDEIGSDILNILKQKAKEGVKVRLLLDHVGSYEFSKQKEILKDLKTHMVKVLFFNSILPFSKNRKTFIFLRNHRRTIIVDSDYLFTGSVCIGIPTKEWIELGIFIKDSDINFKARNVFNQTWNKVFHPSFNIGSTKRSELSSLKDFNYITQSPLQFKRHIYRYYLKSIKASKESIYLISPYFVPDWRITRQLIRASKRHGNVHIILPKNTEIPVVDLARNTYIKKLLELGINIYFHNSMVHSKFSIFDNKQAFIGTLNLDNLSLKYNYECGIITLDKNCISDLSDHIHNHLLKDSVKLTLNDWSKRSFLTKIVEKFVWIFRKFL